MPKLEKFEIQTEQEQNAHMRNYYRLQSRIYDLTRWSFLFGRKEVVEAIPLDSNGPWNILEVGCGTGYNLNLLAKRFPNAHLTGLDVSEDMLSIAGRSTRSHSQRVQLEARAYTAGADQWIQSFDTILFSYSLTMINPHWIDLIRQAKRDLKPGGYLAVADFHNAKDWFKKHMSNHHVRMDGHLELELITQFDPQVHSVNEAYGGIWEYLIFIGKHS